MTAEAQGAIDDNRAGVEGKDLKDFLHHNRTVTSGGGLTRRDYFGDVGSIAFGGVLFVFFFKASWVFSGIAPSALMRYDMARFVG